MLREALTWRGDPAEIVAAFDQDQIHLAFVEFLEGSRPEWHARAACAGADLDLFFPGKGKPTRHALAMCETCTVRRECLDEALADDPSLDHGIRGGMVARARSQMRRDRQAGDAA